ncbi:MAG: DUF4214 domain-containing protein [Holophagales bacterium]|nr:MAG: DUF4214 domain-containing protein [Holophagales bacterium]
MNQRPIAARPAVTALLAASLLAGLVLLAAPGSPAAAQSCVACGPRPYICDVDISAQRPGDRGRGMDARRGLSLSGDETIELRAEGIDQFGRRYPSERGLFVLETGRDCRSGAVRIDDSGDGRFRISAGSGRGGCELWLRVPGNQNLEWRIPVEIRSAAAGGYDRMQSEYIGRRLYLALLGRDADRDGLSSAVAEIQRGRLSDLVEAMLRSSEYVSQRAGLSASQRLEDIYQGLLGRVPDSGGVRRYLGEVERGRVASVVIDIVRSEEFEGRMQRGGR